MLKKKNHSELNHDLCGTPKNSEKKKKKKKNGLLFSDLFVLDLVIFIF